MRRCKCHFKNCIISDTSSYSKQSNYIFLWTCREGAFILIKERLSVQVETSHSRATPLPNPQDTPHGHSHLSTLPYSLLRGQGRQADWLSTKKYLSVLSFSLSKVEPHPPQPQTKQVFYINPIATPRFQNTTSKVRFPNFIYPSSLSAHPPALVCPRSVPSTLPDINVPMTLSHHSSTGSIERQNWWVKSKDNVTCLPNGLTKILH